MRAPGRPICILWLAVAACRSAGAPAATSAASPPPQPVAGAKAYFASDVRPCPSPEADESQPVYEEPDVAVPVKVAVPVYPNYPDELRQAGATGDVILSFVVNAAGCAEPGSIRVFKSAASPFVTAARAAVIRSRYTPAQRDGRPVRQRVYAPYAFDVQR